MPGDAPPRYLVALDESPGHKRGLVGGKAKHLAQLAAAGFPVPPALVVTTAAYAEFMARPRVAHALSVLRAHAAEGDAGKVLEDIHRELVEKMLAEKLPSSLEKQIGHAFQKLAGQGGAVAVRSSSTLEDASDASYSGMLSSFIGVSTPEELVRALKRCWASAWHPRALVYGTATGRSVRSHEVAVIVQRLVPAVRAGVVFTRDPANRYSHGVIVESAHGVGEDVVSGEVTPERYVYYPRDGRVVFVHHGRRGPCEASKTWDEQDRTLTDVEVAELARWGLRAERLFGTPQDLEWVYGDGGLWIVQSRPLILSERDESIFFPQIAEETVILHGIGASPKVGSGEVVLVTDELPQELGGSVVVLERLTNDLAMQLRNAAAVIADEGGATSHGANILREFGVPAVISTGHATQRLSNGMEVTVDGFRGLVYEGDLRVDEAALGSVPPTRMKVLASLLVPEKAIPVAPLADGVSSLRNDYFLLRSGVHPLEMVRRGQAEDLVASISAGIARTAEIFSGKPVWYKTMDAPTDEFLRLAGGEHEPLERNPLLGWRGIGRELREPEMLDVELRAVAHAVAEGHDRLGIKLPFIRFAEEFAEALSAVRRAGLDPGMDVQVGVSIETPAAALRLGDFLEQGASFVSVGLSDLTMCTLALDRESHLVSDKFDPAHPAVLELLERIVSTAHAAGVFVCVTGESARQDDVLPHIVGMGFDAVGVSLAYFADVKRRICSIEKGSD